QNTSKDPKTQHEEAHYRGDVTSLYFKNFLSEKGRGKTERTKVRERRREGRPSRGGPSLPPSIDPVMKRKMVTLGTPEKYAIDPSF
ncbi:hypothetical protein AVEN_129544-1, partial [Araneus ventricosus]